MTPPIADKMRRALGREVPAPVPEAPRRINLRSEYITTAHEFVTSFAGGNPSGAAENLRRLRAFAHAEGFAAEFDQLWIEPQSTGVDDRWLNWYRATLAYKLDPTTAADPGPEPPLPISPLYWREKYVVAARDVLRAYRAGDLRQAERADHALQLLLRETWGHGFRLEAETWLASPQTTISEVLDGWERESGRSR
jgi:hypothetical protein